ncbi:hypothetical protein ABFY57_18960 [Paenibacillus polymyxa]
MNINPNTDDAKQQAQAVMHKFTSNMLEENMEYYSLQRLLEPFGRS